MPEPTFLIPADGLVGARDAAAICGVDIATIYSWVRCGNLPVAVRHKKICLYNLIDVARAEWATRGLARREAPTLAGWGIEGDPDADAAGIFRQFAEHAQRTQVKPDPVVYYVTFAGRIKIGATRWLDRRLDEVPHDALLATEPGYLAVERARHRQFAEFRIYREWFRPAPPLMDHIAALAGAC